MLRATQLVRQQFALLLGAGKLRLRANYLRLELLDLAAQHRRLGRELVFARCHHRRLVGHGLTHGGELAARTETFVEVRRIASVALGRQPCARGQRGVAIGCENVELGARVAVVEPDQELAFFDARAIAHGELAHDAAIRMLHALPPAFDLEVAAGDGRAGDRRERSPHRHRRRADYVRRVDPLRTGARTRECGCRTDHRLSVRDRPRDADVGHGGDGKRRYRRNPHQECRGVGADVQGRYGGHR